MKREKHRIWGKTLRPKDIAQLFRFLVAPPKSAAGVRLWRGQANLEWRLDSSLYRRMKGDAEADELDEIEMRLLEEDLLRSARHRGFGWRENGTRLTDFELLARLQHHGAATRIVDFTKSAIVGLYFACAGHPESDGVLFGLHTDDIGGLEGVDILGADEDFEAILDRARKHNHVQAWEPPVVSPRIAAQHAMFCFSHLHDSEHSSLRIKKNSLLVIRVPCDLKEEALDVLSGVFDVRMFTMFPDLDGFGRANSQGRGLSANDRW